MSYQMIVDMYSTFSYAHVFVPRIWEFYHQFHKLNSYFFPYVCNELHQFLVNDGLVNTICYESEIQNTIIVFIKISLLLEHTY